MEVTIRVYDPRDAADLADVFFRSVRQVALSDYTAAQVRAWAPEPRTAEWAQAEASDGRLVLVAVNEGDRPPDLVGRLASDRPPARPFGTIATPGRPGTVAPMTSPSKHLSERIERPADEVYDYASDPANLPEWAPGLGSSVEQVDGRWFVETSMGRVGVAFAPRNEYGVLDHDVTLPSGEVIYNPVRVITDGSGSEVIFTLRRLPGMSDEEFERDADAVAADLTRLKRVLEGASHSE